MCIRDRSRTSVFTYKGKKDISLSEIGKQLDVSHVLEGSVRKAGQKVRITAQLIRSNDDAHLWSETYDRELKDIFAVQDEIAQTIVNTLKIDYIGHTGDKEPNKSETSVEAYNMYLQGIHFQDRRDEEGMRKALMFFKNTILEDPNFELAYVGLANTYLLLADYGYDSFDENIPLADYNATKAMELKPESAEVHSANAYVSLMKKDDPKKTESFYLKAIELNPNYATAHHWYSDFLRMVIKDYEKEWQAFPDIAGGGELLSQGVHILDLFNWFLGNFDTVVGMIQTAFYSVEPLEDNAFAILKTKDNKTKEK